LYFCILKMNKKSRGIVLRTVKYGDNRLIVDLLMRDGGRVTVAVKAGSGAKSRQRRQLFQPLSILSMEYRFAPHQQIATVSEVEIAEVYGSLPFDGIKMSIAFFLAEFLLSATRDQHTDTNLYDFVERSLLWLDASERGVSNFHLMFMMHLTRFLGFMPDESSWHEGALFDMREGRFCMSVPLHRDFLNADEASKMLTLLRMSVQNIHLFHMTRAERNRVTDLILQFYHIHLPAFHELKSLAILREL